jgi:peptidyl-prolyl cis-trans isomerase A (cyclophilin A)
LTCLYFCKLFVRSPALPLLLLLLPRPATAGEALAAWMKDVRATTAVRPLPEGALALPPGEDFGLGPGQALHARFVTSVGSFSCRLAHDDAPVSVRTFVDLARGERAWIDPFTGLPTSRPLYEGTIFHRVIPGFLVQGGDPTGTGTGGPGFTTPDENPSVSRFDGPGVLALANRGPNANGSQFFVTDGAAHHLDGRYTVLGFCSDVSVIARIASAPRGERNRPVRPVVLERVEISVR